MAEIGVTTAAIPQSTHLGSHRSSTIIVVPAYNEERNITRVVQDLRTFVPHCDRLFVNDGAKDGTGRILNELGERQLTLPCNLGYGRALQAGLRYALDSGYDLVVTFDADGQHRASDIPCLLNVLHQRDVDVVIGSRYANGRPYAGPLGRRIGQRLFSYLTRLVAGQRVYDTTSGLKGMRAAACRRAVEAISHDFHTETIVVLCASGYRIAEEPITMQMRTAGRSMHSLSSIVTYPLQTLLVTLVALIEGKLIRSGK